VTAQRRIQDRFQWGLNRAAQVAGEEADAYRPRGHCAPLSAENRYMRLPALFTGMRGRFERPLEFGTALCQGIFDASYTQAGDYLVQGNAIWFIASQDPLLPVLCVRANSVVSFYRPEYGTDIDVDAYGGIVSDELIPLADGWPASVLGTTEGGRSAAELPGDKGVSQWIVILPRSVEIMFQPADLMRDDLGRSGIVSSAERSDLGWRLLVKQAIA
jgi:hypothetical protein